jgi:hypothetical protein
VPSRDIQAHSPPLAIPSSPSFCCNACSSLSVSTGPEFDLVIATVPSVPVVEFSPWLGIPSWLAFDALSDELYSDADWIVVIGAEERGDGAAGGLTRE